MNAAMLRRFPLFGGMEESELDALARLCACEEYPSGIYVTEEGRLASALFVVERGEVEIEIQEKAGAAEKVSYVEPSGVFGHSALLPPYTYDHSVRTLTPVRLLTLDATRLQKLFEQRPRLGVTFQRNIIRLLLRSYEEGRLEAWK